MPIRAQIIRNQRQRLRQGAAVQQQVHAVDDAEEENGSVAQIHHTEILSEKIGTKKRAKMEAKAQKRMQHEQDMRDREERKIKEAKMEEERKKMEEREAAAELKRAEAERLAREERERKEHEEYLKLKEAFSIDEEGYEEPEEDQKKNLLDSFIQYIKEHKVVILEELASEFKLKPQQAIDRVQELKANNTLTGVIDDRGKFIYIAEDELLAVAKFIKQRGRVSIAELAESSNNLINLTPVISS